MCFFMARKKIISQFGVLVFSVCCVASVVARGPVDADADAAETTQYQAVHACEADKSWVTKPSMPEDVTADATNCEFQQFMWRTFLYLVQPEKKKSAILNFETWMPSYGIFVAADKQPTAWGSVPKAPFCASSQSSAPAANHVFSNLTLQAGSDQPLIDKQGNDVFYTVSVNKPAYQFITGCDLYRAQCALTLAPDVYNEANFTVVDIPHSYPDLAFPDYSIELKASWKVLTDSERRSKRFYTVPGTVQSPGSACLSNVTLGLVGMHIIYKTPNHPEFIWATFEHKNNAPNCSDVSAKPPLGGDWTFYNSSCQGEACDTNTYFPGKPTQVCRMHPWGDPTIGTFPNNLNCESIPPPGYICDPDVRKYVIDPNTANLKLINASVEKMLHTLKRKDRNRLWANYELVGNVWTKNGSLPPVTQSQFGSLASANTTMETFVQNGVSNMTNPNNCFSCHNLEGQTVASGPNQARTPVTLPPAGLSHIFNFLDVQSKGCGNGTALPAACPGANSQ